MVIFLITLALIIKKRIFDFFNKVEDINNPPSMWVDRVFTIDGIGKVVTGTASKNMKFDNIFVDNQESSLDIREIQTTGKKIISSSSSGLLPTKIYSKCKNPERGLIGHPFNPVYLLPLVEIVPGKKTSKKYMNIADNFYKSISMNPILLKKELPGYLSDRLQEALWREGLHIINEGYATTENLDRSIEDGPGLRLSLIHI